MTRLTAIAAVLAAVLVVGAAAGGGIATASTAAPSGAAAGASYATDTPAPPGGDESVEPADTVYVTEDGDAILVYRQEGSDAGQGHVGVNVSEGLVNVLVRNETRSNLTGEVRARLNRTRFVGHGSGVASKPGDLKSLDFEATRMRTTEVSRASVSLQATIENESFEESEVESFTTEGRVHVTGERFEASGSATYSFAETTERSVTNELTVTGTQTGYRVDVVRTSTVYEYGKKRWDTRENATRTLRAQYNATAQQLNGTSELTVRSYEFREVENGTYRLEISYTVEYRGVRAEVADKLARSLARSQNVTLTAAERRRVSEKLEKLDVEKVSYSMHVREDTLTTSFAVRLADYDDVVSAALDVAAANEDLPAAASEQIQEARKRLAARRAANLKRTTTWSGTSQTDGQTLTVDFESSTTTKNWQSFVTELQSRGLDLTTVRYEVTARTQDGQVVSEAVVTVTDDHLVQELLEPTGTRDAETKKTFRRLRQAGFRRARLNGSVANGTATVHMAAKFANMSALQKRFEDAYGVQVASIAGRPTDDGSVTYVRVENAVGEDASREDVRELQFVGEDTDVKMPGEWDREFPAMDVERVERFLGYDPSTPTPTPTTATTSTTGTTPGNGTAGTASNGTAGGQVGTSTPVPGFGFGVALLALLAAAALASRRDP